MKNERHSDSAEFSCDSPESCRDFERVCIETATAAAKTMDKQLTAHGVYRKGDDVWTVIREENAILARSSMGFQFVHDPDARVRICVGFMRDIFPVKVLHELVKKGPSPATEEVILRAHECVALLQDIAAKNDTDTQTFMKFFEVGQIVREDFANVLAHARNFSNQNIDPKGRIQNGPQN